MRVTSTVSPGFPCGARVWSAQQWGDQFSSAPLVSHIETMESSPRAQTAVDRGLLGFNSFPELSAYVSMAHLPCVQPL